MSELTFTFMTKSNKDSENESDSAVRWDSIVARCIVIIALSYSNVEKVQPSESETRVYDQ